MNTPTKVFDRCAVKKHRNRIAHNFSKFNFLFVESASRLHERIDEINRPLKTGLDLGCHGGELGNLHSKIHPNIRWVRSDLSINFAKLASISTNSPVLVMDEEVIAFKDETFDIILSNLSLHWVNDIPGTLNQLRRCLKPDGVLLATFLGEETLTELQQSFVEAEIEIENGLSPRFSPLIEIKSAGDLLVRAGFSLPVANTEKLTISYPNAHTLMNDLRGMGESNSHTLRRQTFSRRSTLNRAADIYNKKFKNEDGRINATFDIIYVTGWAPHESQPKPLKPGSGDINFETALNSK